MFISLIRTIILYICVIAALRMMGKRQIGELEPSDLVITILISDLAAIPMQDTGVPLLSGVIPIVTLIILEIFMSFWALKSRIIRRLLNGRACIVIRKGKLEEDKLRQMRITCDEILEALRQNNIESVSQVKYGVIEANGKLTYVLKNPYRPLTAQMMPNVVSEDSGLPLVIISDGKLVPQNLKNLNKEFADIQKQLHKHGISRIQDVLLMTLDDCGNLFLQAKEGRK